MVVRHRVDELEIGIGVGVPVGDDRDGHAVPAQVQSEMEAGHAGSDDTDPLFHSFLPEAPASLAGVIFGDTREAEPIRTF